MSKMSGEDKRAPALSDSPRDASDDGGARVLILAPYFEPGTRAGGPIRSIAQILDTASQDIRVCVITRDHDYGSPQSYPDLSDRVVSRGRHSVFYFNKGSVRSWVRLVRLLRSRKFDTVYINSIFDFLLSIMPVLAYRVGLLRSRQLLIAPRGEFNEGALSIRTRKKRAFLSFWRYVLEGADPIWHATSRQEASEISAVIDNPNVIVVEVQTGLPLEPITPEPEDVRDDTRVVFIGRVSTKKNVALLLRALKRVSLPISLTIYGPIEEDSYWRHCRGIMRDLPPHIEVEYRGVLDHADVRTTFAKYDAFVFPTRGENFGHIIAESLSASCPVLCSPFTPWSQILENGGGSTLSTISIAELAAALQCLAASDRSARYQARLRAGEAYSRWRVASVERNVLTQALED